MFKRFQIRGYLDMILEDALRRAGTKKWETLLVAKNRKAKSDNETQVISYTADFDISNQKVRELLRENWKLLKMDKDLGTVLLEFLSITYRKSAVLGDLITKNYLTSEIMLKGNSANWLMNKKKGFSKYPKCKACTYGYNTKEYKTIWKNKGNRAMDYMWNRLHDLCTGMYLWYEMCWEYHQ